MQVGTGCDRTRLSTYLLIHYVVLLKRVGFCVISVGTIVEDMKIVSSLFFDFVSDC